MEQQPSPPSPNSHGVDMIEGFKVKAHVLVSRGGHCRMDYEAGPGMLDPMRFLVTQHFASFLPHRSTLSS